MTKTVKADDTFGLNDNRYFIDVPKGEINTFFEWTPIRDAIAHLLPEVC
ncbi:MAG: hypothetical protein AAFW84_30655 [Cyanobacteria bacterium J06635_15]